MAQETKIAQAVDGRESGLLRPFDAAMEEEMIGLYQNIQSSLAGKKGKVVLFIGSRKGEGVSLLAREFAKTAALKFNARVLLLDADGRAPSQAAHFGVKPAAGWEEACRQGKPVRETVSAVGGSRLSVSQVSVNSATPTAIFDSARIEGYFNELRDDFDFILVDSPAVTDSTEGLAFSYRVDGVVLVIESEETRWQVAQAAKERIEKLGGSVLGVILNKRRHYIPRILYDRL